MPQADTALAEVYADLFRNVSKAIGLTGDVALELILAQKGVLKEKTVIADENDCFPLLQSAVLAAVTAIDIMRSREGEVLMEDLKARRNQISEWVEQIRVRAPQVVAEYRQKLKIRLNQLLEGTEMDESRLTQEVAMMADRCDVTEELVRLSSHFIQFDETFSLAEPVGRKLDFLMQEMNREINTIGSKSSDAEITGLVIRIKAEMEKMREQVQNVE